MRTLYRVISDREYRAMMATGRFQAGPNSFEAAKWFAERRDDLRDWSEQFEAWDGVLHRHVISIRVSVAVYASAHKSPWQDGIGPAVCIDIVVLNSLPSSWRAEEPLS